MRRRDVISLLGRTAVAWPLAAHAQRAALPVIGFLHLRSPEVSEVPVNGLRRGLAENNYVEGQNVLVQYRWGRGEYGQMPALAEELVRWPVDVIVAGSDGAALAAKAATSTIPIVFSVGSDPVKLGLVASFNRPGGTATGVNLLTTTLEAKRLGLLRDLVPRATAIAALINPGAPNRDIQLRDIQEAGRAIGIEVRPMWASTEREIDAAFDSVALHQVAAIVVTGNPFFDTRRDQILALAARHRVPAMYQFREFAAAGGLVSYGIDLPDVYREVGVYVGRILKGAKPADLPVLQPTKFELVINLKTARSLGVAIPPGVLAIADDVIE